VGNGHDDDDLEQVTQSLNRLKISDDPAADPNEVREPDALLSIHPVPGPSTTAIQGTPDADSPTPICRRRSFRVVSNLKSSFSNKKSTYPYSRSLPISQPQADHDTSSGSDEWLLGRLKRLGERLKEKMALRTRRASKQRTKRTRTHDHMPASLPSPPLSPTTLKTESVTAYLNDITEEVADVHSATKSTTEIDTSQADPLASCLDCLSPNYFSSLLDEIQASIPQREPASLLLSTFAIRTYTPCA
jgi:hypothetical protein